MLTLSRQRLKQQPRIALSINRENPLGARVLSAVFGGRNIVNGKTAVLSGAKDFRGDPQGLMTSLDGSSYLDLSAAGLFNDETKPVTICYFSKPLAAPTYAGVLRVAPIAAANEFVILRGANGTGYDLTVGSAPGTTPVFAVPARTNGVAERVVVVASQGMQSSAFAQYALWINRIRYTSVGNVNYTAQPTNGTSYFGWDGPDSKWAGLLDELFIFDGVFSNSDAASYFNDPWQMFNDIRPTLFGPSAATVQILRPASDISAGAWVPSSGINLFSMVNEAVADDANYITTPTPSTCELKLSLGVDPVSSINHLPAIRCRGTSGTITVNLMQGATVKATFVLTVTLGFTTFTPTLTTAEIDSISDYGDLRYRFTSAL